MVKSVPGGSKALDKPEEKKIKIQIGALQT